MNAFRIPAHGREGEVRSVADGPETDLIYSERFAQVFEIVGTLVAV